GDRAGYISSTSSLACFLFGLGVSFVSSSRTLHACVLGSIYKIQIEQ
uniref:Uncharacterized protein n=1 Tax=Aegilops tauschii subsp. strangulata TaxID=200361 RepID=A0A453B1H4_AEGTS